MEQELKQLAAQFAEQNQGEPGGEPLRGIGAVLTPKTDDEILENLIGLSFEEQAEIFNNHPAQRRFIKRLIIEESSSEENSYRWTVEVLKWLGDILGVVEVLRENGPANVKFALEEGLEIINRR